MVTQCKRGGCLLLCWCVGDPGFVRWRALGDPAGQQRGPSRVKCRQVLRGCCSEQRLMVQFICSCGLLDKTGLWRTIWGRMCVSQSLPVRLLLLLLSCSPLTLPLGTRAFCNYNLCDLPVIQKACKNCFAQQKIQFPLQKLVFCHWPNSASDPVSVIFCPTVAWIQNRIGNITCQSSQPSVSN